MFSQVIDLYHPLALRLFLMGTHYRSPINYSDGQLESASDRIFYIYQVPKIWLPFDKKNPPPPSLSLRVNHPNVVDHIYFFIHYFPSILSQTLYLDQSAVVISLIGPWWKTPLLFRDSLGLVSSDAMQHFNLFWENVMLFLNFPAL